MKDMISVIIPVYNVEEYLCRCVDSILNQTYKNLEIILVDDGSPDNCGKICDEYAKKDSRIKVIHKENGGLSDARNKGLMIANGEYVMFVDSDDYVESNMIEVMYDCIINQASDMVVCRFVHVDTNGKIIDDFEKMPPNNNFVLSSDDVLAWFSEANSHFFIVTCCKLYKKQLFRKIQFPIGKINEDEFVAHLIMGECNLISFINKPLYYYTQHSKSIMHSNISDVRILDVVEAFLNRTDYYFNLEMNKEAVKTFYKSIDHFNTRNRKLMDNLSIPKRKNLLSRCRFIYIKNIFLLFKYLSLKSFVFVTLFIINMNLPMLMLKIFKRSQI